MRNLAVLGAFALAGCTTDALINTAFPDGERFSFTNPAGDAVHFYVCEGGPDAAERARKTHVYYDRNLTAISERAVENAISRTEGGQGTVGNAVTLNREMNANVEVIVENAQDRYQCLLYDSQEI